MLTVLFKEQYSKSGSQIGFAGFPSTVCFSLVGSEFVVASEKKFLF